MDWHTLATLVVITVGSVVLYTLYDSQKREKGWYLFADILMAFALIVGGFILFIMFLAWSQCFLPDNFALLMMSYGLMWIGGIKADWIVTEPLYKRCWRDETE